MVEKRVIKIDRYSETWEALETKVRASIGFHLLDLERCDDPARSQWIRGKLAALREVLAYPAPAPAATEPEEAPFGIG